jgi:hypothetical protein
MTISRKNDDTQTYDEMMGSIHQGIDCDGEVRLIARDIPKLSKSAAKAWPYSWQIQEKSSTVRTAPDHLATVME